MRDKIVHLLSGGLDSTVLLYELERSYTLHAVIFDYGQKHSKEIQFAISHADKLKVKWTKVELLQVHDLFKRSALTDGKGGYIVPNRNAVFCHIAASIAMSKGFSMVSIGCNKQDQTAFPDCRWKWIKAINDSLESAETGVEVIAPYIGLTKWQILKRAKQFGVTLDSVWWCYEGKHEPCRKCPACKKMQEAIE